MSAELFELIVRYKLSRANIALSDAQQRTKSRHERHVLIVRHSRDTPTPSMHLCPMSVAVSASRKLCR